MLKTGLATSYLSQLQPIPPILPFLWLINKLDIFVFSTVEGWSDLREQCSSVYQSSINTCYFSLLLIQGLEPAEQSQESKDLKVKKQQRTNGNVTAPEPRPLWHFSVPGCFVSLLFAGITVNHSLNVLSSVSESLQEWRWSQQQWGMEIVLARWPGVNQLVRLQNCLLELVIKFLIPSSVKMLSGNIDCVSNVPESFFFCGQLICLHSFHSWLSLPEWMEVAY